MKTDKKEENKQKEEPKEAVKVHSKTKDGSGGYNSDGVRVCD